MKNYGVVKGAVRPQNIEVTNTGVFIASNIKPYEEVIDDKVYTGFSYNYTEYTKDEYIAFLHNSLIDTQLAILEMMEDEG